MKIKAGDVLVNINDKRDPLSVIMRLVAGPYSHALLYIGPAEYIQAPRVCIPQTVESNGRGVTIRSLAERYGELVAVARLKTTYQNLVPKMVEEAVKLASDFQAYYDFMAIGRWVLPRLIAKKLKLPIPLSWHRDRFQVCSEAVYEIFCRAGLGEVLSEKIIPMPEDFLLCSPILDHIGDVVLSQEFV